jgi:hypothetical protein
MPLHGTDLEGAAIKKTVDGDVCLQTLHWLWMKRINCTPTHTARWCSLTTSSCWTGNVTSARWWVIVHGIQHILLTPYIPPSTTNKCKRHESNCFSHITTHPSKYTSIYMLIFLNAEREFPSQKPHTKSSSSYSALLSVVIFVLPLFLLPVRVWLLHLNYVYFHDHSARSPL